MNCEYTDTNSARTGALNKEKLMIDRESFFHREEWILKNFGIDRGRSI